MDLGSSLERRLSYRAPLPKSRPSSSRFNPPNLQKTKTVFQPTIIDTNTPKRTHKRNELTLSKKLKATQQRNLIYALNAIMTAFDAENCVRI